MRFGFRKHEPHEKEDEEKKRIPPFCIFLMAVGFLTLLYLFVDYVLMPVLAMLTVS